ncbi:MAG: hypothetical protein J6X49_06410 [Victivallales bacterium]|nr:hypothetical protein [Victivallales bacterium]
MKIPRLPIFALFLSSALIIHAATLQNGQASWDFSDSGELKSVKSNGATITLTPSQDASIWTLVLRDKQGRIETLTTHSSSEKPSISQQGQNLTITWQHVKGRQINADLTVTLTAALRANGATAWTASVSGQANAFLWNFAAPVASGLASSGDQALAIPEQGGKFVKNPTAADFQCDLLYPYPASMQFLAYWQQPEKTADEAASWHPATPQANGLLIYAEDAACSLKKLAARGDGKALSISIQQLPPISAKDWNAAPNVINYKSSYPVVVAPFQGDCLNAAAIYRQWALQHFAKQAQISSSLRDLPAIITSQYEPATVISHWFATHKWLNLPLLSLYHNYTIAPHAAEPPQIFPLDPYFPIAVQYAQDFDVTVAPCLQARKLQTDSANAPAIADKQAVMASDGTPCLKTSLNLYSMMDACPVADEWRTMLTQNAHHLVDEQRVSALLLEELLAPSLACYNPAHSHALHGGSDTIAALQNALRAIRKNHPSAGLVATETSECLVGTVDAFATPLCETTPDMSPAPLFDAVYHGHCLLVGANADFTADPDVFSRQLAAAIANGHRPAFTNDLEKAPAENDRNAILARNAVQAFDKLLAMNLTDLAPLPVSLRPLKSELPSHPIDIQIDAKSPTVRAIAYANDKTAALLIVNFTDTAQKLQITTNPVLPIASVATWPPVANIDKASSINLELPANNVQLVAFSMEANWKPFEQAKPAPAKDVELFFADKESMYFPFKDGATDTELWSCEDGIIARNAKKMNGLMSITSEFKSVGIRKGPFYSNPPGEEAVGVSLPRDHDTQPFAVIRKLPFTLDNKPNVFTMLADDHCILLHGLIIKKAKFNAPRPGVFVARICTDKEKKAGDVQIFTSQDALNKAFEEEKFIAAFSLGFAELDELTLTEAINFNEYTQKNSDELSTTWEDFSAAPTMEKLGFLTQAAYNWLEKAKSCPELFAMGAPGYRLLKQVQCLARAAVTYHDHMDISFIAPYTDWLFPGVQTHVAIAYTQAPQAEKLLPKTKLMALGVPTDNDMDFQPIINKEDDFYPGYKITLKTDAVCDSLLTVAACLPVTINESELYIIDLAWFTPLKSPHKVIPMPYATISRPGYPSAIPFILFNMQNNEASIQMKAQAPDGWRIAAEPQIAKVDALANNSEGYFTVNLPQNAPEGQFKIPVTGELANAPLTAKTAAIHLDILNPVQPVAQHAATEEKTPMVTNRNLLVGLYAAKGEQISIEMKNDSNNTVVWKFYNRKLEAARQGEIKANDKVKFSLTASNDADFFIELLSAGISVTGTAAVTSSTHALSQRASAATPMFVSEDRLNRAFFVPNNAKLFSLNMEDQPANASVTLLSPTGRKFEMGSARQLTVTPKADELGKPWKLEIKNALNARFWLAGDAIPWLATSTDTVLKLKE